MNEPTTFPPANRTHGSHHWTFERLLAAGLVPLTGAAFVTSGSPAPLLDGLLGLSLIVHSHIGVRSLTTTLPLLFCFFYYLPLTYSAGGMQFDSVLVDYIHKRKFPKLGPLFTWTLRLTSVAVGVGVYQFNTNDIGAR